jgi:outer membrane autotransporter protein
LVGFSIADLVREAQAQVVYDVPASFSSVNNPSPLPVPPAAVSNGSTFNLGNSVSGDRALVITSGATGGAADLTLNAINGSSTITINSSATGTNNAALFRNSTNTVAGNPLVIKLAGGPVTLTGASVTGGTINGGVINSLPGIVITGSDSSSLTISGNTLNGTAQVNGGAFYSRRTVTLTLNGAVNIINNSATTTSTTQNVYGGAIADGVTTDIAPVSITGSTIIMMGNTTSGNRQASGGVIYSTGGDITLTAAGKVVVEGNKATGLTGGFGGAIYSHTGAVLISGSEIIFSDNEGIGTGSAGTGYGGGIVATQVTLTATERINLEGNKATGPAGGFGGAIWADGTVNLSNPGGTTLTGNSASSFGGAIYANSNFTLTTGSGIITNNSAGSRGGAIWAGGNITLNANGGDIIFSGNQQNTAATPQANAIWLENSSGTGTMVLNATDSAIRFFDPVQNNAANGLINVTVTGGGSVVFDAFNHNALIDRWSQVYGTTIVTPGTHLFVQNNAVYGVQTTDVAGTAGGSSFTVANGAILAGGIFGEIRADHIALNGTLNIAGLAPAGTADGGFSTFTLTSTTTDVTGGRILFNTWLGNDASPTDRLVISGAVSGTAVIHVNAVVGSPGALTAQGIRLVEVIDGGTTASNAFRLGNRVVGGAYEYLLFRGSADGSTPDDWFLRSNLSSGNRPIYRPEAAVYAPVPVMARSLGLATIGTLHQRVGEQENLRGLAQSGHAVNGMWGRVFGELQTHSFSDGANPSVEGNLRGLQTGVDLYRNTTKSHHRDHAGLYFAYGSFVSTSLRGNFLDRTDARAGSLRLSGPATGVYWTHFGPSGWYMDGVAQHSWYDTKASSISGSGISTQADGITASLETGYPTCFYNNHWIIEPQLQLIYQNFSVRGTSDNISSIGWNTAGAWTGRLGMRLQHTQAEKDSGRVWQPYGRLNLWQDFTGSDGLSFDSSAPINTRFGGFSLEGASGLTAKINNATSLYGEASYRRSITGSRQEESAISGTFGLRFNW